MPSQSFPVRTRTAQQLEAEAANIGLIHEPEVVHPVVSLAYLKQLMVGGGLFYADPETLGGVPRSAWYFGDDAFLYDHVCALLELYDFSGVPDTEIDAAGAMIPSLIMTMAHIMGPDAAWRMWNAIFDQTLSGVHVKIDPREPVANLRVTGDVLEHRGHDARFPTYRLRTHHTLRQTLDKEQYMMLAMTAPFVAADSFVRIALKGATDFVWSSRASTYSSRRIGQGAGRQPSAGSMGSIGLDVLRKRPDLLSDHTVSAKIGEAEAMGGGSWFDLQAVKAWGDGYSKIQQSALGQKPSFPVWGLNVSVLDRLSPAQRYGAVRTFSGGGTSVHSGLDIAAPECTPIVAIYDGVIAGQLWGVTGNKPGSGNMVHLRSSLPGGSGYTFDHLYGHMIDLAKLSDEQRTAKLDWLVQATNISRDELERTIKQIAGRKKGDFVRAGEIIGFMGSTGNSSGPHLHLTTSWAQRDGNGHSLKKLRIDPELVIEHGAIEAGRKSGFSIGGAPPMGEAAFTLRAVGEQYGGLPSRVRGRLQADLAGVLAEFKRKANMVEVEEVTDDATGDTSGHLPAEAGPTPPPVPPAVKDAAKRMLGRFNWSGPLGQAALTSGLAAIGMPPALVEPIAKSLAPILQNSGATGDPTESVRSTLTRYGVTGEMATTAVNNVLYNYRRYNSTSGTTPGE